MQPYLPRPIEPRGVVTRGEWHLKRYTITNGPPPLDDAGAPWPDFDAGRALAYAALPLPAVTPSRPGVGFIVEHRGNGADYIVLAWWDRENELPVRVIVREHRAGAAWRPARERESFCVWDLQVIGWERDAYVETMMGGAPGGGTAAYLARQLHVLP